MMFSVKACVAEPPPLSVTLAVKLARPGVVGVPVIAPAALSERPRGRDPVVTDQVNPVPVPPDATSVCEYGAVASPAGKDAAVVMLRAPVMLSVKASDAKPPPLSVTLAVKLARPGVAGMPVIAPAALSERPEGKDPAVTAQVNPVLVPPDAASVCEYGLVASPAGSDAAVVMLGPAMTLTVKGCVAEPPMLSVTLAVKLNKPTMVGVPLTTPAPLRERPGTDPAATVHVNPVFVPPDAASVCE
jgi:hypothetical protein